MIAATPINKRFFSQPPYLGNYAFVPINAAGGSFGQAGDLLAVDLTNLSSPALVGTLEQPIDPVFGGAYEVTGVTQASGSLLLRWRELFHRLPEQWRRLAANRGRFQSGRDADRRTAHDERNRAIWSVITA